MKIVIFGLTLSSSWGNGHATLWRGLCRALIRASHRVVFFERDLPYYAEHRDLTELSGGSLILFRNWEDNVWLAQRELLDADVGIVTSYCPDGIQASSLLLSSPVPLRVFYDLDTPVTLDCLKTGRDVSYLGPRGLHDFDLVLSYTGGQALEDLKTQLGARSVAPLYGSVDPESHYPVQADSNLRSDLSYLGTYAADRQPALERLFVQPAQRCPQYRFLIGGAQYPENFPWTENIFFARHVAPGRHPAFFCSSRLTLNVTRAAMRAMGYCPSGRLFEAVACGAPVISDSWEGLDHFFAPNEEILVVESADDVISALQLSDAELRALATRARERVLTEHTATQRASELEGLLEAALSGKTNDSTKSEPELARDV
ncbi:MAG: glycosyltransferase [Nibricoccus sp.]